MPDEIKIEQLQLSERDGAITLVKKGYGDNPRMSDAQFWDWHYAQVPEMEAGKPPIWAAKAGERIVAQVATIPVEVNIAGERRRAIWIVDMVVDPDFRRRGLAKKLVLAAEEFCHFGLVIGTNEQHSDPLLQSLGYRHVAKIPRFHKLLFPANDVREIANLNFLRKTVNLAFAPFRPRYKKNKNVRAVESFDASFDELWAEAEAQWSCAVRRTSKFLEWQYARQPGKRFDVIGYYEGEKLLGYAVLFFRKPRANGAISKAAITDICYHTENPKKIVDALLQESLRLAVMRGTGGLVTDVLDDLVEERLSFHGFWRVKSPLQFMVKSADRQDLLYNPEKWFVTRGDADVSIFEDPNL